MKRNHLVVLAAAVCGATMPLMAQEGVRIDAGPTGTSAEAAARRIAGKDPVAQAALFLCNAKPDAQALADSPEIPAGQVSDNLYFVGTKLVSAWLWRGPDGVVLIDTLNDGDEARSHILANLSRLGVKTEEVKLIAVTHGHRDHSGGVATLMKALPNARLAISPEALAVARAGVKPGDLPFPEADVPLKDGMTLAGGLRAVSTPGHSPGTMSLLLAVRAGKTRHVASLMGGSASHRLQRADLFTYIQSTKKLRKIALTAGADFVLSNHPVLDNTREWLQNPGRLKGLTPAQVTAYYRTVELCARAHLAPAPTGTDRALEAVSQK